MRTTVERILEPRALWGIARIEAGAQADIFSVPGRVVLPREDWYNGTRHTMVLTHLLLAPTNYLLQRNDSALTKNAQNFNNAGSILSRMRVFISAPGIYFWSTEDLSPVAPTPVPMQQPSMEYTAFPYASSLFGVHRWDFDFEAPFWLPRQARIQFDLSGWGAPDISDAAVSHSVLFNEKPMEGYANRLPATARLKPREVLSPARFTEVFPEGPTPFQPDAFTYVPKAGGANSMWFHKFMPNVWDRQESSRGVTHSEYSGFAVAIDQNDYDDDLQGDAAFVGEPVTALANRIACRARTTNGGSQEWWWRPGAPLSLLCPTVGTATTFKFEKPIVLAPGDAIAVEVQAPELDADVDQTYQLGVSMLGYARIES